ncbi:type IV pilus modification PilV family protein [Gilvimarinus japonicus]|uniref:Prepilin-type N-terminal cleavage/methylation domain-containing protein n=1 Tax=Gilvimarinus japonicus TaxID=1796469 RepID=A0ABV7HQK5_9GAMM
MRINSPLFHSLNRRVSRGVSLIELIVFIVVISVVLGGLLGVYQFSVVNSADPVKRLKMLQYAQARLDAVMALRYDENTPSGGVPACDSAGALPCNNTTETDYDDVDDYHDVTDWPDSSSAFYSRAVAVELTSLNGLPAKLIQVTVTTTDGESLTLAGYRVNF